MFHHQFFKGNFSPRLINDREFSLAEFVKVTVEKLKSLLLKKCLL